MDYNGLEMDKKTRKEEYITSVGIGFMGEIVPDFLKKAFDAYENALDNFKAKGEPFRHSDLLECV